MITTRTFKSGNSVAVRLPRALGISAGTEIRIRPVQDGFVLEPVEPEPKTIDLTGIYGAIPDLRPLAPGERVMEPRQTDREGSPAAHD